MISMGRFLSAIKKKREFRELENPLEDGGVKEIGLICNFEVQNTSR